MTKLNNIINESLEESLMNKKIGMLILSLLLSKPDNSLSANDLPNQSTNVIQQTQLTQLTDEYETQAMKNVSNAVQRARSILSGIIPNEKQLDFLSKTIKQDEENLKLLFWDVKKIADFNTDTYLNQLISTFSLKPDDVQFKQLNQIIEKLRMDNSIAFDNMLKNNLLLKKDDYFTKEKLNNIFEFLFYRGLIKNEKI